MYVVPTPFRLVDGVAHQQTLILPADVKLGKDFFEIGKLRRRETAELVVGYSFNLKTNELIPEKVPNPSAGREHSFRAWRLRGSPRNRVGMRDISPERIALEVRDEAAED
jgi:hypothetical protein